MPSFDAAGCTARRSGVSIIGRWARTSATSVAARTSVVVIGSRRGETCAIRWRRVDLRNGVLHLEKAIAQDGTETWEKDIKIH